MSKIKTLIALFVFVLTVSGAFAQSKFSGMARLLLHHIDQPLTKAAVQAKLPVSIDLPEKLQKKYLIKSTPAGFIVHGTVLTEPNCNEAELVNLGVEINTRTETIWTVTIPVKSLYKLGDISGVKFIDIDMPVKTKLDSVRIETGADFVQEGFDLNQAYNGESVVIGVIDNGFDYTHPTFYDDNNNLRISRVWDQEVKNGTPPVKFTYGNELIGSDEILAAQHALGAFSESHGTHVAGIAAGSGLGSYDNLRGMAPNVELVFVALGAGASAIIDAVNYIFSYAESVQKPAVINMSLGTHIGPHDGTSLQDQAFDLLSGPGKVLVGAAGNEGETKLHIYKEFTTVLDTFYTIIDYESDDQDGILELWGSPNSDFSVALVMADQANNVLDVTNFVAASSNGEFEAALVNGTDSALVSIATTAKSNLNQKPNITLEVQNHSNNLIFLAFTSSSTQLHIWNHGLGNGANLVKNSIAKTVEGDVNFTTGEIGGTANSVLSVGAYTTKNHYYDIFFNEIQIPAFANIGELAPFSSRGPTVDGRTKPEITAPGNIVASAGCSFDTTLVTERVVDLVDGNWPYVVMEGTSMATPVITGVVALMLQANPDLTKEDLVDIFSGTSRTDLFTGVIPAQGSNIWGYGKIDAYEAVKSAETFTSVTEKNKSMPSAYILETNYPNPFNPATIISYSLQNSERITLKIYDIQGRLVQTLVSGMKQAGRHQVLFQAKNLASGVYYYRLKSDSFEKTRKMLLLK